MKRTFEAPRFACEWVLDLFPEMIADLQTNSTFPAGPSMVSLVSLIYYFERNRERYHSFCDQLGLFQALLEVCHFLLVSLHVALHARSLFRDVVKNILDIHTAAIRAAG